MRHYVLTYGNNDDAPDAIAAHDDGVPPCWDGGQGDRAAAAAETNAFCCLTLFDFHFFIERTNHSVKKM